MYSISIFLFYILLIWGEGCVRTQRTPRLRACAECGKKSFEYIIQDTRGNTQADTDTLIRDTLQSRGEVGLGTLSIPIRYVVPVHVVMFSRNTPSGA